MRSAGFLYVPLLVLLVSSGVRHAAVEDALKVVTVPREDGLCSIHRVYKGLIHAHVDPSSGQCSNYSYIREQIVQVQQCLERSEQAASAGLSSCDTNLESLTRDQGQLEQEMSAATQSLHNFRTLQASNEDLLIQYEGSLEQARRNLDSARDELRKQEERRRRARITTGVGVGFMSLSIVGLIAGFEMVASGAAELERASHAVRSAEQEERGFEALVENYRSKVSDYVLKISQTEENISRTHAEVEHINEQIQEVGKQREAADELQGRVRKVVHGLRALSGKASVAEVQTREFILQEPVRKLMEDLMKAAEVVSENELISSAGGVPNNRKLAAICASQSLDSPN